jgi:hypothetical protein
MAGVGTVLVVLSTLLHPRAPDANDMPMAFAMYAAEPLWTWIHVGQFVGLVAIGLAFVSLAETVEVERKTRARAAVAATVLSLAMAGGLQAVDGIAFKAMLDRWTTASGDARAVVLEITTAVYGIKSGFAALAALSFGITWFVFGLSLMKTTRHPSWLGVTAWLGALVTFAAGIAQAGTGFSGAATILSNLAGGLLLAWIVAAGITTRNAS